MVGVKAFLCDSGLAEYPHLDEFALLDAMQTCAELGLLLALHAEDARRHTPGSANKPAGAVGHAPLDWAAFSASRRPKSTRCESALDWLRNGRRRALHFVHISTREPRQR